MMKLKIKDNRIELIPEKDIDRARLAQIPEGSNEVFIYNTLDGGDEGDQEALVIHIGPIPPLEEEELEIRQRSRTALRLQILHGSEEEVWPAFEELMRRNMEEGS